MTLIRRVLLPLGGRLVKRDVVIEGGVVVAVCPAGSCIEREGAKVVEADGMLLLPAFRDPHVHVREPGYDYKEDWTTCSKAALKGGASCICDMPNNEVAVTNLELLEEKRSIALEKSFVNFGLYVALTEHNAMELHDRRVQAAVCGIKVYMAETTGRIIAGSDAALSLAFGQPKPVLLHTGGAEGLARALSVYETASRARPALPALYVCHVSTGEELVIIRKAKRRHPGVFAEVAPHHLLLERDSYAGYPGVLPPLSGRNDVEALWEAVADRTIDTLGTDHAPHTIEEKSRPNPPSGFPGLETAMPLMLASSRERGISLGRLVELVSSAIGEILGFDLKSTAGRPAHRKLPPDPICEGSAADLALFEEGDFTIGEDGYVTKCGWSPYHGWKVPFRTSLTVVGGTVAYEGGAYTKPPVKCIAGKGDEG